ncbi:MAG: ATP-dependent RecD-like DNA helicase [Bdellovibrionales bacterium]|nr:ATP-dependent RecD-like DNA helicase [Bdellovibrionales bacterium]
MRSERGENSLNTTPENVEELVGSVARVTFQSPDSGFVVLKVEPSSDFSSAEGGLLTVVGETSTEVHPGMCIVAAGDWQEHDKFGTQFRALSIKERLPHGRDAVIRYLAGSNIKGFGPATAERIVDMFGEDALRVIREEPERLLKIPGIGRKRLEDIRSAWGDKSRREEQELFFHDLELPRWIQKKLFQHYGARAVDVIQRDPYLLVKNIPGVGFKTADKIAQHLGIDHRSDQRIAAAIIHVLQKALDDGHCYVPSSRISPKAESLLGFADSDAFHEAVLRLTAEGQIVENDSRLYLPNIREAEQAVAADIAELVAGVAPSPQIPASILADICSKPLLLSDKSLRLSEAQAEAVKLAAERKLLVVTGGPGCGKTTVVRAIAKMFRTAGLVLKLAAPTGRAAQRLSEVCGMEASTIHRLLRFDPVHRSFVHNRDNKLEADVVIIDETSMVDLLLARSLLEALPKSARVLFVGDADQLPSVGPGLFLGDLLRVEQVPRIQLTTLFRRDEQSDITRIAHELNSGRTPNIPRPDGKTRGEAYFLAASDPMEAASLVERLVVEQIPKKFGIESSDVTVLSPMNQGDLGIEALNQRLQSRIVPDRPSLPRIKLRATEIRLGDRVVQRVNNYQLSTNGVFNGDQGVVVGIDPIERTATVQLWDGREVDYPADAVSELDLAYAITIHRSQGSEVPAVVLILHDSHYIMLERQLAYTAVTRAKKLLIVVGTKRALILAGKRTRSRKRFSSLVQEIQLALGAGVSESAPEPF